MDSGGAEETEPLAGPSAAGPLGPGASADAPPSSPRNPLPGDLAAEATFGGWPTLEYWDNYLTIEEENLEQWKRRLEEECGPDWAELAESRERVRRLVEQYFEERCSKSEESIAQALLERRQIEKRIEEDRAEWDRREADAQRRIEEAQRQMRDLDIQNEALKKILAMQTEQEQNPLLAQSERNKNKEDQLQKPLLLQPEHKHNKDWNLIDIVSLLAFASGLILFMQMQAPLSLDYPKFVVDAFATLWAMGSVILSFKISRRFRRNNRVSHYIAPFASLFMTLLGLCVLYLISRWVDGAFSGVSPCGFGKQ